MEFEERFSRHLVIGEIGESGQRQIKNAKVLVCGAGGLGSPILMYLASNGIGSLGIVDDDVVELSNLHRQLIHDETSCGLLKVDSAEKRLRSLNSNVFIEKYACRVTADNALELVGKYDVVVDATDNIKSRYILNDACALLKKPLVSGCVLKLSGQVTVYNHHDGPCYRCLFPIPPPPDAIVPASQAGIFGVVPGIIGMIQAMEILKVVMNLPCLSSRMILFDCLASSFSNVKLRNKSQKCPVCGPSPSISISNFWSQENYNAFCQN